MTNFIIRLAAVSCKAAGATPKLIVRLVWGSKSTANTFLPSSARE